MRTTVTIPDELVKQAIGQSGHRRISKALASTLEEHFALKKRLALLDMLFAERVPHRISQIKKKRRKRRWSS